MRLNPGHSVAGWTVANMRSWCLERDYRNLLSTDGPALAIPVAERFDWNGRPIEPGFRRVRVIGRQLFVLSRAALGGNSSARACARLVADALLCFGIGDDGQFVARVTPDGRVIDATADLYDIAFGLFGLAWWYRVSGDQRVMLAALQSVAHLRKSMASPSGLGFVARADGSNLHSQNTHMHLFEASLFLSAFLPHSEFNLLARDLMTVAEQALFDPKTGTIAEEFDNDWRPLINSAGKVRIEPGHQFEWAWLLDRYARLTGGGVTIEMADRLFEFGQHCGVDRATGLVFDAVASDGCVLDGSFRIWPNTERMKAQVAMAERPAQTLDWNAALIENLALIHSRYLAQRSSGSGQNLADGWWIDYLCADGYSLKCDHVPASTHYHILFAFSELLRFVDGQDPFSCQAWSPDARPTFAKSDLSAPSKVAHA